MSIRDDATPGWVETRLAEALDHAWRTACGSAGALVGRLQRWRRIRVTEVSEEWLVGHEIESSKHRDGTN